MIKNVLLITADELRADCTGFSGNPDVSTPCLDALAARGAVFGGHFAPFPKCVPSRCAMLTGRHPHTDGLRSVAAGNHLPAGAPSLPAFLRGAGYETAVLGLNHVWEDEDFYGAGDARNTRGAGVVDYTSFTDGLAHLAKQTVMHPPGEPRRGPHLAALGGRGFTGLEQGPAAGFCDENRAAQAVHYLTGLRDRSRPFYLQLNLSKPHPPYGVHEPFYSMYDPARLVRLPHVLPTDPPLPMTAQRRWRGAEPADPAALAEVLAVYYGMVSFADSLVGGVLAALESEGLASETLVIFTSDHGDYAGQHGLLEKWDTDLRDCLLKVPLIIAGPGIPGMRTDDLSSHVDLPATILELLGLRPPLEWSWHGRSMVPMLRGAAGQDAVFAGGGHEAAMRARVRAQEGTAATDKQRTYLECPDAMARAKMVRTTDWKLVVRGTGGHELYHIADDPWEMRNLHGHPGFGDITAQLQARLLDWCLATDPDRPFVKDVHA